ncbi:MAG: hypothetical protein FD152_4685 [Xanthobacteraceae bacterium]|nr:MAG: hypothetical protein FD152_4685 [Xanthobacteraceae bacterium]
MAIGVDHPGGHVVDGDIGRGGNAALCQFLEDHCRIEAGEARAADIVAHIDAAKAEARGLAQGVLGKDGTRVPVARVRLHLVPREVARHLTEGFLVLGESEIHRRDTSPAAP